MSAIKPGDLVMVVRGLPCCGFGSKYGSVFKVTRLRDESGIAQCKSCGGVAQTVIVADGCGSGFDVLRLKKIDPPAEGDSLPTRAEKHDEVPA